MKPKKQEIITCSACKGIVREYDPRKNGMHAYCATRTLSRQSFRGALQSLIKDPK